MIDKCPVCDKELIQDEDYNYFGCDLFVKDETISYFHIGKSKRRTFRDIKCNVSDITEFRVDNFGISICKLIKERHCFAVVTNIDDHNIYDVIKSMSNEEASKHMEMYMKVWELLR